MEDGPLTKPFNLWKNENQHPQLNSQFTVKTLERMLQTVKNRDTERRSEGTHVLSDRRWLMEGQLSLFPSSPVVSIHTEVGGVTTGLKVTSQGIKLPEGS